MQIIRVLLSYRKVKKMQDVVLDLLCRSPEVLESISKFLRTLPAYQAAQRDFYATAEQVREKAGPELFSRLEDQFLTYTNYEVLAYYAFGLGLREELVRALSL